MAPRNLLGYGGRPPQARWPGGARVALQSWIDLLRDDGHPGVPLASALMPVFGLPGVGAIHADASGGIGFGAWTLGADNVVFAVADGWTVTERDGLGICEKEFHASNVALAVFGE